VNNVFNSSSKVKVVPLQLAFNKHSDNNPVVVVSIEVILRIFLFSLKWKINEIQNKDSNFFFSFVVVRSK